MRWNVICAVVINVVLLSMFGAAVECGEFRSGAAMRIITPDPLLPVSGGVGEPQATTEKRGELTARAMVFSDGTTTIAVVGIDVLGFPSVLGDRGYGVVVTW